MLNENELLLLSTVLIFLLKISDLTLIVGTYPHSVRTTGTSALANILFFILINFIFINLPHIIMLKCTRI